MALDDKMIRINDNYFAFRVNGEFTKCTEIEFRLKGEELGTRRISISSRCSLWPIRKNQKNWPPATINWSALGDSSVEATRSFVEVLTWAVAEAERLNQENGLLPS